MTTGQLSMKIEFPPADNKHTSLLAKFENIFEGKQKRKENRKNEQSMKTRLERNKTDDQILHPSIYSIILIILTIFF